MVVASVVEQFCGLTKMTLRPLMSGDEPMLPTNSTLIPSCVNFFPSRTRMATYSTPLDRVMRIR